jgi:hypothetical protein
LFGRKKDGNPNEKEKGLTQTPGTDAGTEDITLAQEIEDGTSGLEETNGETDRLEYVEEVSIRNSEEEDRIAAPFAPTTGVGPATVPSGTASKVGIEEQDRELMDVADMIAGSLPEDGNVTADQDDGTATPPRPVKSPLKWTTKVTKDQAVRDLNNLVGEGLEGIGRQIGAYATDKLAGGNYQAILNGNVKKSRLFNEILNDERLLIDSKRLYEFTIAEALRRQCMAEQIDASNLKTYHFVAAYRVKDEEARLLLLSEANENKWGVRRILREASDFGKKKPRVGVGRDIIRMVGSPLKALEDPEIVAMCSDKKRLLRDLSASEREQIKELVEQGKPSIESWGILLERLDKHLSDIDEE